MMAIRAKLELDVEAIEFELKVFAQYVYNRLDSKVHVEVLPLMTDNPTFETFFDALTFTYSDPDKTAKKPLANYIVFVKNPTSLCLSPHPHMWATPPYGPPTSKLPPFFNRQQHSQF